MTTTALRTTNDSSDPAAASKAPEAKGLRADEMVLEITDVTVQTELITSFSFRDPTDGVLPSYVPGSHVVIRCGASRNAYSLTGSGNFPSEYSVSVLRVPDGEGGSQAMHRLQAGERVVVSRPRSAFPPVATARHHLLVAAGIGITPMLSHARAAAEWGRSASMIYAYRPGEGAHVQDARRLLGNRLTECLDRKTATAVLSAQLADQPMGTHLYVCGPAGFMEAVLASARALGWPEGRLHSEPFGVAKLDPGQPFQAELVRSGRSLSVPAGVSLLEALENSGIEVPNMCRRGVCGECVLPVLRGTPQHRDLFLTESEKAENKTMMCCVSRSTETTLELDL